MKNSKEYDFLIVGAGLAGSVAAYELTKIGKKCLVIDKRNNIAGNCYTEKRDGIPIHMWGAHIFHTNSKEVWDWVNQFTKFNNYHHKAICRYQDRLYSFPINLKTLNEVYPEILTPTQAKLYFESWSDTTTEKYQTLSKNYNLNEDNLETHCVKQVGPILYEMFIRGYTKKQWGTDPKNLPSRIIKRIPVRTNLDDTYFHNANYEGIPVNGYNEIFENCLKNIEVRLNVDYLTQMEYFDSLADQVIYTGPLDEYFKWDLGELEWRSLEFQHEHLQTDDFQGTSVVNYNEEEVPFTRIIEHKHFVNAKTESTWITKEYPKQWKKGNEPFYPIADDKNNELWHQYKTRFTETGKYCAGRLADYKYYDMDQVIGSSLSLVKKIIDTESSKYVNINKITNEWLKETFEKISEEEHNSETIHNIAIRKNSNHIEIYFLLDCDGYGKHDCLVYVYYDGKVKIDFMDNPIDGSSVESEFKNAIEQLIKK